MRRLLFGLPSIMFAGLASAQALDHDVHYYASANISHNLIFLGSSDQRAGGGFGFAFGRNDPKIKLFHKIEGELIWEGYYLETNTMDTDFVFPNSNSKAYGLLATARYTLQEQPKFRVYGDLCVGAQFIDHATRDLPICNNSTLGFGIGAELLRNEKSSFLIGTRMLHQSNGGRKRPNYGQNLLQWYIGFRFKY